MRTMPRPPSRKNPVPKTDPEPAPAVEIEIASGLWRAAEPAIERLALGAVALALEGEARALSLRLADDAEVRRLNAQFRGRDKATNVLSFPAPPAFPADLGDVVLAFETVAREAVEQEKTLADHARHLIVHGILHLRGRDHENEQEAAAMEDEERAILARLGIADPYA